MMFFASFFNLADANGKLSALTLGAMQKEAGNTYTEVSLRSSQGHISKEAVYDSTGDGRGGISEEQIDEYDYPTTADDALVADLAPLTIDQSQDLPRTDRLLYGRRRGRHDFRDRHDVRRYSYDGAVGKQPYVC